MAIDPSISLSVKPAEPVINQFAEYANLARTMAELPGIQADTALKVRQQKWKEWQTNNSEHYVHEIEPVGADLKDLKSKTLDELSNTEVAKPQMVIDTVGYAAAAAKAGFYEEAQSVAAHDLANQAQALQNKQSAMGLATTELLQRQMQISNDEAAGNLAVSARGHLSNIMEAYRVNNGIGMAPTPDQQKMLDTFYAKNLKGLQDQFGKSLQVTAIVGEPPPGMERDEQGQMVPAPYHYNPAEGAAWQLAASDAAAQEKLAQDKATYFGPAGRDPNSDLSKSLGARVAEAAGDKRYLGMSAAQLMQDPVASTYLTSIINPQSERAAAVTAALTANNQKSVIDNGINAINRFNSKLTGVDAASMQSRPSVFFSQMASKFMNDPDFVAAKLAYERITQSNPDKTWTQMSMSALMQDLKTQSAQYDPIIERGVKIGAAPTIAGAGAAAGAAPSGPRTTKMKSPGGKTYDVPSNEVAEAKARGLVEVQ